MNVYLLTHHSVAQGDAWENILGIFSTLQSAQKHIGGDWIEKDSETWTQHEKPWEYYQIDEYELQGPPTHHFTVPPMFITYPPVIGPGTLHDGFVKLTPEKLEEFRKVWAEMMDGPFSSKRIAEGDVTNIPPDPAE